MELSALIQAAALVFSGFAIAIAALLVISSRFFRSSSTARSDRPDVAFLFQGKALVDATPAAHRLLSITDRGPDDIARLVRFLEPRFPELHDRVMNSGEEAEMLMRSEDGLSELAIGVSGGRMRIALRDLSEEGPADLPDRHSLAALGDELATYRALAGGMPVPAWLLARSGRVVWANAAYHALLAEAQPKSRTRDPGILFPVTEASETAQTMRVQRQGAAAPDWFEVHLRQHGQGLLGVAVPIDRAVRAERSLNEFVQTLSKTFADLSVGLAVFNRERRLAIFNPALTDMLKLRPEFLIGRPTLFQVFDRLRETRLIPEPKNYKTWRQKMNDLEAEAAGNVYAEDWQLADGRTYRVTGRPHPDGAVAFIFEDVTAELTLQRRFRADLMLGQSVIDRVDEAIAVFSPAGALVLSNKAFSELWQHPGARAEQRLSFLEASRIWQKSCVPTPIWGDARDFAATIGERSDWMAEVRLRDGRRLGCRFDALPGGNTLVGFSELRDPAAAGLTSAPKSASA